MRKPHCTDKHSNLWESTVCAVTGLITAIRTENKIRQVVISMVIVTAVTFIADVGYFQILMVIFSWVVALICEMFNTALEKALDFSGGKDYHPLIRDGKDFAGASTFIALVFAGFLSLFVLWGRFFPDKTVDNFSSFQTAQR